MKNIKPPRKCRVCGSNMVMFRYKDETSETEVTCVNCGLSIKKFGSETDELVDIWNKLHSLPNGESIAMAILETALCHHAEAQGSIFDPISGTTTHITGDTNHE